MKIAFLSFYSGVVYRGVETFVHQLSNSLVELGHKVIVYQLGQELPRAKYQTVSIPIRVDWEQKGSYKPLVNYYALRVKEFTKMVLRQIDRDVDIVFPTNGQWQGALCRIWTTFHRKKLVISGQSGPGADDKMNLFACPSVFVGLTDYQAKWVRKVNPFVKVKKIPNGVDLADFRLDVKPLDINLQDPVILCVSAFDEWKRLDLVIRAVARLKRESLLLVGKGRDEKKLRSLGTKLLGKRFKIMSFPHSEMPKVYAASDLFTYATVPWESFGIVLVEAMGSGLPVVATDDPIRREIVGDAGFFVDPRDTDAYAKALREALVNLIIHTDYFSLSNPRIRVFSDRLTLPVATLEREVVGFNARRLTERKETTKYKNSPEGEIFSKRDVLFGSEFIDPDYVRRYGIILVEGQLDTLGFLVQGHRNVAAISSTILTYEHIELIKRLNPQNIYLMCDGDKPGIRGSIKNANSLLASHLYSDISIVPIHERGKDPFDVFFTDKQLAFRYIEREALKPIDFVKRCNPEDLVDDGTNGDKLRFLRENTGSILRRDDLKEMGFDLYS